MAAKAAHGGTAKAADDKHAVQQSSVILLAVPSEASTTAASIKAIAAGLGDVTGKVSGTPLARCESHDRPATAAPRNPHHPRANVLPHRTVDRH